MLGDGRKLRPAEQEQLAAEFLTAHQEELIALRGFAGVETLILGLVYICPLEATGIAVSPSPELIRQADEIGIVPIYYVTIDGR